MSGGHFDSAPFYISQAAEDVEREILRDFKYIQEDWDAPPDIFGKRPDKEYDRLGNATPGEREFIVNTAKELCESLKKSYWLLHELDYLLSGDTGPDTFIERINHLRKNNFNKDSWYD